MHCHAEFWFSRLSEIIHLIELYIFYRLKIKSASSDVQMSKSVNIFTHFESSYWCYTVFSHLSGKACSDLQSSRIWKPKESPQAFTWRNPQN